VNILHATLEDVLAVANADLEERVCGDYGGPYYMRREEYHRSRGPSGAHRRPHGRKGSDAAIMREKSSGRPINLMPAKRGPILSGGSEGNVVIAADE
jgi:hypothetical protein